MNQLHLFPTVEKEIHLVADSPKSAWWNLKLIEEQGKYTIVKDSGISGKRLDRRVWPMRSRKVALKTFNQKVKQKLNSNRRSPRKYKITYCND